MLKLVTTTVYNSETEPSQCWHTVAVRGCMERGWPGRVACRWAFVVFSSLCWEVDFRQGIESESPFFSVLFSSVAAFFPFLTLGAWEWNAGFAGREPFVLPRLRLG